jgi:hypothetical protein
MWNALDSLPDNEIDAYQYIMQQITGLPKEPRARAFRTLSWILSAKRPLTMAELKEAIRFESSSGGQSRNHPRRYIPDDSIIRSCRGFVICEHASGVVRFNHKTVQEFLESERSGFRDYSLSPEELAMTCVTYLELAEFDESSPVKYSPALLAPLREQVKMYRFGWYAAQFWGFHVRGEAEKSADIQKATLHLLANEMKRNRMLCIEALSTYPGFVEGQTLLHVISRLGLATICRVVLEQPVLSSNG